MLQKLVSLNFLTLAVVCLATEAQVVQKGGACPSNWIWQASNPSVCYYISTERLAFHAADKSCKDKNSSLASASSSEEHTFISSELIALKRKGCNAKEECVNFWIGLQLLSSKSNWTHVDGSQISTKTSFWDKGYPSGKGNCGLMHVQDSDQEVIAYWRDENCDEPRAYICKQGIACPDGFFLSPNTKNCYKYVSESVTWSEASKRCRNVGDRTHLAMITNAEDNKTIYEVLNTRYRSKGKNSFYGGVWTSGRRQNAKKCDSPTVWKPTEGTEVNMTFTNWGYKQPDCSFGTEDCVVIRLRYSNSWNDVPCHNALSYLAYVNIVCNKY